MELFDDLEQNLRTDQEFFNKMVAEALDILADPETINGLFDLQSLVQSFVE